MTRRHFPPDQHERIRAQVTADITAPRNLNPTRRHRTYPRVVKRHRHGRYRIKQTYDIGTRHTGPPTITIATITRNGTLINSS